MSTAFFILKHSQAILGLGLVLLCQPLTAQTIGGEHQTLHQWDGLATGDRFGDSVSGAGDVNRDGFADILVGSAWANHNGLINCGSAFVYSGADGKLLYQWNGLSSFDSFGSSVAPAKDFNQDGYDDVLIGAPLAKPNGLQAAGSVYIYSGFDGSLLQQFDGGAVNFWLGVSVASAGDVNADGSNDVILGAAGPCPGGTVQSGSAYVYSGLDGSLLHEWCGTAHQDSFGNSVASAGDTNGDGYADLIVGAFGTVIQGGKWSGSAFVYSGADGSLLHQWDGVTGDVFGLSVAGAGDFNRDGFDDVIVGAHRATANNLVEAGSAYLYSGLDGSLLHQWNGNTADQQLGWSVAGAGDVNGDGFTDVIVGMRNAVSIGLPLNGSAMVYLGPDGSLLKQWSGESVNDFFADSVAAAGDVNGDGFDDVLIGAYGADPGGLNLAGSAYVFSFNPFLRANQPTISASTGGSLDLDLNFPANASFDRYKILVSASGTGPMLFGVQIPLTMDNLVYDSFIGQFPYAIGHDLQGTLDASGTATAGFLLAPGFSSSAIGQSFYIAAIANRPGQLPEYSSAAVTVTITP